MRRDEGEQKEEKSRIDSWWKISDERRICDILIQKT